MNRLITILFLGITTIIMQAKTDKEQIETLYRDMYEAMVAKDTVVLNRVHADDFALTGRSRVTAAVFGDGRHTWHLQLTFQLVKRNGQWMFTNARASTY